MTTVVFRDGVFASDTLVIGGDLKSHAEKMFVRTTGRGTNRRKVVIGVSGTLGPAMLFVDWYGKQSKPPERFLTMSDDSDFDALVWDRGKLFTFDRECYPMPITDPFYAIGSGAAAALGAMHKGASAVEAVRIAMKIDSQTGGSVKTIKVDSL